MTKTPNSTIKNFARGGGTYHDHRVEIVRALLSSSNPAIKPLSPYLREQFFKLRDDWTLFKLTDKDWPLCDRLLATQRTDVEDVLLGLVAEYVLANETSVSALYAYGAKISDRLLSKDEVALDPEDDALSSIDAQSLFGARVQCASNKASTNLMIEQLEKTLTHGWARARLINPLVYHASASPPATTLDSFLSYLVTGREHNAEKLALKLMLSDEAARETSLAFKLYIGLMGHPYDAIELVLDHSEIVIARGEALPEHLAAFLRAISVLAPASRAGRIAASLKAPQLVVDGIHIDGLAATFGLTADEVSHYAELLELKERSSGYIDAADRPFDILTNMRSEPYPDPLQFQIITTTRALWHFTDAGRLIGAILRSFYMVDRASRDLEARDVVRLIGMLGYVNPFVASAPSAMFLLRNLPQLETGTCTPQAIETQTQVEIHALGTPGDRLWINQLQWTLRALEEAGQVQQWLNAVRSQTKLRPSFLTGINWHWVEDVIAAQRIKPFRSFDGAYLFVHMEMETNSDPQRLRLTLEPLIRNLGFDDAISVIIEQFGVASQAIVRRYFTTANLLASGMAANYVAALDLRVRALEDCIFAFDFGPLLTEEIYENEVKTLTTELLLTDVNTGKFEVPWDTFHKDAAESHEDLFQAVTSLQSRFDEKSPLSALVDVPVQFPNGRSQTFRVRNRDQPVFALLMTLISDYMQHPAFGIEVILSGRFRHNNLMQEVWGAMADVASAQIPSVTNFVQNRLIEDYRPVAEDSIDAWCLARLQTDRPGRSDGLFNLVPTQAEADELVFAARVQTTLSAIIDVITTWIKNKLRDQVERARDVFEEEVSAELVRQFEQIKARQTGGGENREQDVQKVHVAVSDAVLRRVKNLRSWFDGVDTINSKPISLSDLSAATEALFDKMFPDRALKVELDPCAAQITYQPNQVKIAFDLLREIYFNALTKGCGQPVKLIVKGLNDGHHSYAFSNAAYPCPENELGEHEIAGHRYVGQNDAVKREGNSGRAKIAASSATLVGCDTAIVSRRARDTYELIVRMAKTMETLS
jgi:hypothetical protein